MTRFFACLVAAGVALVAGIISYGHIRSVALSEGESPLAAALLPFAVDGAVVVASLALLTPLDSRGRRVARFVLWGGIAATVGFNIASAKPGLLPMAVAATAAVAFLGSVEVLRHLIRTGRPDIAPAAPETAQDGPETAPEVPEVPEVPVSAPARPAPRKRTPAKVKKPSAAVLARQRPDMSVIELANLTGVSERHARRLLAGVASPSPNGSSANDEDGS